MKEEILGPVFEMVSDCPHMSVPEKHAINNAIRAGDAYGYGNLMAWLATAWAVRLRDDPAHPMPEKVAIEAVSGRGPYSLPRKKQTKANPPH